MTSRHIMAEVKRRGVLRAGGIYAAVAFVVLQVADLVLPALGLGESAYRVVVLLTLGGFPMIVLLSWFFDLTPEGLRRTGDSHVSAPPLDRRLKLLSVGVISVLLVAGGGLAGVRASLDQPRSKDGRIGIAIFPFRSKTAEWAEGLPDLLATAVDGTEGFRVIDPWGLWAPLRASPGAIAAIPDPVLAAEHAKQADARRFVLGAVVRNGDSLSINIRLYDPRFARPLDTFSFNASPDGLVQAVQRLAVEIITRVWDQDAMPGAYRLEPNVTRSPDALKAYLAARMAMRRGQVDSSAAAIDRALAIDSTFALALAEAVVIRSWWFNMRGQPYSGFLELLARAEAHDDLLTERYRLRILALKHSVRTNGMEAAATLRRLIEIDSTDISAWAALAYSHQAYGWQYGATDQMAIDATERVLRLDPAYVPGITTNAWLRLNATDSIDPSGHIARLKSTDTTSLLARSTLRALRLLSADDSVAGTMMDEIVAAPIQEWTATILHLRALRPARLLQLFEHVPATPTQTAARMVVEPARIRLAAGDAAAVDSALNVGTFAASGFDWGIRRMLVAGALAGMVDTTVARHAAEELAQYVPINSALALFDQRPVWAVAWILGAWHSQIGNPETARRWRDLIGRFPAGGSPSTYREALQADIESRLAVREGNMDEALARARDARAYWYIHSDLENEMGPSAAIRLHLALLERDAGRSEAAEALFRSLVPPTTWIGFYTTRAQLELAEIAAARGDNELAARRYGIAFRLLQLNPDTSNPSLRRAATGLAAAAGRIER